METLVELFNQHVLKSNFSLIVLIVSFLGGVLASISPCSLSVLPIVIAYVTGTQNSHFINFLHMLLFVLGISITMTVVGILCAITGSIFTSLAPAYGVLFMAGIIFILGLNMMGLLEINYPVFIKQLPQNNSKLGLLFPVILGAVFALASTPCSTPILAAIMTTATLSANYFYSALMLLLFAFGQGVIIILAGIFTSFFKNMRSISSHSEILMKISGFLLILFSLYIYYKVFSKFF